MFNQTRFNFRMGTALMIWLACSTPALQAQDAASPMRRPSAPTLQFQPAYFDAAACARMAFLPGYTGACAQYVSVMISSTNSKTQGFLATIQYLDATGQQRTQTNYSAANDSGDLKVAWIMFYNVTNITLQSVSVAPLAYDAAITQIVN